MSVGLLSSSGPQPVKQPVQSWGDSGQTPRQSSRDANNAERHPVQDIVLFVTIQSLSYQSAK